MTRALHDLMFAWLPALAVAAALVVATAGYGRFVLRLLGAPSVNGRVERVLWSVGLGAGLFALLVLALGLAGWLVPAALAGLLAAGACGWIVSLPNPPPVTPPAATGSDAFDRHIARPAWWIGLTATCGLIVFGVLMPEFFHDALIYHLELPRYYLDHHAISVLPWNYNSALPATVEMLYVVALAFADERAAKLIHAGLGLLCVLTVWRLGRIIDERDATGRLAGILFLTTPALPLLATVSGNDLGLVLFELLSLFAWLRWQRGAHRSWLVVSALLMGAALGTKYSAAFFLTGFGLAWVMCVRQPPAGMERAAVLRQAGLWLLMVTAVASPWYLRTFWATGHPFYPALAAIELQPFMDTAGLQLLRRDLGTGGVPPSLWADYLPRLAAQDIGWLTLAAAIVGVVSTIQRPALRPLLPVIIGALPVWWLVSPVPRYLLPVVALLALFAAAALSSMAVRGRAWRVVIVSLLAAGMIGQWSVAAGLMWENYRAPWQGRAVWYWLDGPARSRWLAWSVPPYAVIDIANRTLPPSATVLFVGEYRGYYLRRDRIIGTKYNRAPLIQWAEASPTPEALAARLRDAGVTHLLYNQIEARRLGEAGYPAFDWPDPRSRELFEQFRRESLTPIAVENGVVLYALRPAIAEPAR